MAQARAGDRHFTLRRLLRPLAAALIIGLVLDGLDAVAGLALPALVRNGIDHGVETKAFQAIVLVSLIGLAIVLADWLVNRAEIMVVGRNGERLLYTLRVKLFAQLQRLGLDFYEREMSGRILTRMTTDVDALSTFLQTGLVTMVSSVLTFFGVLAALLIINLRLGLAVLCLFPVLVVATLVFRSKSARAYNESRERVAAVNARLRRERGRAAGDPGVPPRAGQPGPVRRAEPRVPGVTAAGPTVHRDLLPVRADAVHRRGRDRAGAGDRADAQRSADHGRADRLPALHRHGVLPGPAAVPGLRRLPAGHGGAAPDYRPAPAAHLHAATGPAGRRGPAARPDRAARRGLQLRCLQGGRPSQTPPRADSEANALSGINLTVEPGETVALVGQTGAGKSTLVKIIARFYDATGGQVLADGTDVRDYDLASYRHQLGIVPQESYLFAGTVRDSIAYARPDASDAEVEAAARATGAHDMIIRLTGGYAHEVAERGRNLSAGQRQLIALARAQLADPAILLLDEATAALDLAAEAAVNHAISELTAARTTIVVAHRLTTAARADRIVVLDQGRIVEAGSHDELLAAMSTYAALWDAFTGESELVA